MDAGYRLLARRTDGREERRSGQRHEQTMAATEDAPANEELAALTGGTAVNVIIKAYTNQWLFMKGK
jgi:hypothetical protein